MQKKEYSAIIMLIEDDQVEAKVIRRLCRKFNPTQELLVFDRAEEAWSWLLAHPESIPDLIFLDLNLPGWSGLQLLDRIRTHERLKGAEVVILTTSENPQERQACESRHISGFLHKKIDTQGYAKALRRFLLPLAPAPANQQATAIYAPAIP